MHLSWLGSTAVKIQSKPLDQDVLVVIDPYKPETGNAPRSMTPQIALFTHGEKDAITLSGEPFVMNGPGECEVKGVLITGVQGTTEDQVLYRIDTEGMSLAHLGRMNTQPTDAQLGVISGIDILLIPFGGEGCYDAEQAVKAVNTIEPRIVIPIGYKSDNDPKALPVEQFLKEIGVTAETQEQKVIIKKKDLPQDEMKVIVVTKE